jgi:hypothetical protein
MRLTLAAVADHQQRPAAAGKFPAVAPRKQLDVAGAVLLVRISLRARATVALDVGGVAEGGEQGLVSGVLGERGGDRKEDGAAQCEGSEGLDRFCHGRIHA